jgi:hypothetical protein
MILVKTNRPCKGRDATPIGLGDVESIRGNRALQSTLLCYIYTTRELQHKESYHNNMEDISIR